MTLEQVDELYEAVGSARKSTNFVPTVNFARDMQGRRDSKVIPVHVEEKTIVWEKLKRAEQLLQKIPSLPEAFI